LKLKKENSSETSAVGVQCPPSSTVIIVPDIPSLCWFGDTANTASQ
jgi:hypothetical protein